MLKKLWAWVKIRQSAKEIFKKWVISFPRSVWRRVVKILRVIWNIFLNGLIFIGGLVMLVIVVVLSYIVWNEWQKPDDPFTISATASDTLRNLIFAIGGVGAAIGLWFAKVRQEKFSDQVQTQIDQSFNDKLGRGVELLASDKVSMRQAGLRVLDDLIKNTKDSHQKHIIANIIHDFIREKARIRDEKVEKTEDRQDIN